MQQKQYQLQQQASWQTGLRQALVVYLQDIELPADRIYSMVVGEAEHILIEVVMQHCQGNQYRAAKLLGLGRSTLRRKIAKMNANNDAKIRFEIQ